MSIRVNVTRAQFDKMFGKRPGRKPSAPRKGRLDPEIAGNDRVKAALITGVELTEFERRHLKEKGAWLKGLPFPPSDNALYRNVPGRGRVKSGVAREFLGRFHLWALDNVEQIRGALTAIEGEKALAVWVWLGLPYSRLFTLAGEPKRIDASNHGKILLDRLAGLMSVDDSKFFDVRLVKYEAEAETVTVWIGARDLNVAIAGADACDLSVG